MGSALSEFPQPALGEHEWSLWMKGWAPSIPAPTSSQQQLLPWPTPKGRAPTCAGIRDRLSRPDPPRPGPGGSSALTQPGKSLGRIQGIPPGPQEGIRGLAGLNSNTNCPSVPQEQEFPP